MRHYTDWEKVLERVTFVRNKTFNFFLIDNWETPKALNRERTRSMPGTRH